MKRIFFLLVLLGSLAKSYAGPIVTFYEDFSLKIEGEKVYLVKKYYSNRNKIAITSYEKYLLPFTAVALFLDRYLIIDNTPCIVPYTMGR